MINNRITKHMDEIWPPEADNCDECGKAIQPGEVFCHECSKTHEEPILPNWMISDVCAMWLKATHHPGDLDAIVKKCLNRLEQPTTKALMISPWVAKLVTEDAEALNQTVAEVVEHWASEAEQ